MNLSRHAHAFAATLALAAALGTAERGAGQDPASYRWYAGGSGGTNFSPVMRQAGHNRDTICYPTFLCSAAPEGYRWFYDLTPQIGTAFEVAVGRDLGRFRLEVSAARRSNGLEEQFTALTFLDGSPVLPNEDSRYASTSATSVDALTVRTVSLNAYHDFGFSGSRVAAYVGAGIGLALGELSGLYFSSEYSCISEPCDGRPAAEYNSRQDVDLSDTGLATLLFAGADYPLEESVLIGLKASYGWIGALEATSRYDVHPLPGTNSNEISGISPWSVMLGLKYLLGG